MDYKIHIEEWILIGSKGREKNKIIQSVFPFQICAIGSFTCKYEISRKLAKSLGLIAC